MDKLMDDFIRKIVLRNTIHAAFQRGKVYANNITTSNKALVTESIKTVLVKLSANYINNNVTEQQHIENITNLAQTISQNHGDKLREQRLRIGTAQKLLNVYIKFLWCLNEANEPIHCPIDGIVLREINVNRNWTELDSIDDYCNFISSIREIIPNGETIARWEHRLWNERA